MKSLIKKIDKKLLPESEENRLAPFVWLVYLFIFYFSLAFGNHTKVEYLAAAIGTLAFLGLYFWGYWLQEWHVAKAIIGIVLLGSYFGILTPGASVFFVYAGAFCCRLGNPKRAVTGLALIVVWTLLLSWLYQLSSFFYIPGIMFTLMIGGVNIYQAEIDKKKKQLILSQEEVKTLARTAERERIARDLHDLIGHTFSVITLKAELAGKLVDKDLLRAKDEIKQLENISRDALKQVREVVTGFRTSDLNNEFAHAKFTLESNDINFQYQFEDIEIDDNTNKELAIILKELITNILKHAHASKVSATLSKMKDRITLEVQDNGVGIKADEKSKKGFGLRGIGERVEKLKGTFSISAESSTAGKGSTFTVSVPEESLS